MADDGTYGILGFNERVIDGDNMNIIMLDSVPIDDTSNSAKAVDSDVGRHSGSDEEVLLFRKLWRGFKKCRPTHKEYRRVGVLLMKTAGLVRFLF